jgi:dipeptidase E
MQNVTKDNHIYLSGGGNEEQSFPLDKFFFETFPKNGNFLYIPVALRGNKLYSTAHLWMKKVLELHNRNDVQFEVADDLAKYQHKDLKKFDAIYIGGGNTWNLMQELRDSDFSQNLVSYIKNGGVVYGGSAGAIVLGKNIDTHDDENKINVKDTTGFNLLGDYSVACHYTDEQERPFREWAVSHKSSIVCLSEETGLIFGDNSVLCVGTKPCIIYFASGVKKEITPNASFAK